MNDHFEFTGVINGRRVVLEIGWRGARDHYYWLVAPEDHQLPDDATAAEIAASYVCTHLQSSAPFPRSIETLRSQLAAVGLQVPAEVFVILEKTRTAALEQRARQLRRLPQLSSYAPP
jgi:hypothetical protein